MRDNVNCVVHCHPATVNIAARNHVDMTGAYAGFLRGGPNFKIFVILDIHAAKRHVASSEAASLC